MELALALLALIVAVGATVGAVRSHRAVNRLALEMVKLDDRLAKLLESQRVHTERTEEAIADRSARLAATLTPRLRRVEERLRGDVGTPSPVVTGRDADPVSSDPEVRIRQQLRRRGYERVAVLSVNDDGSLLVEAEREGITSKGLARIDPEGHVVLEAVTSLRAFP